jgi:hypothetical protein
MHFLFYLDFRTERLQSKSSSISVLRRCSSVFLILSDPWSMREASKKVICIDFFPSVRRLRRANVDIHLHRLTKLTRKRIYIGCESGGQRISPMECLECTCQGSLKYAVDTRAEREWASDRGLIFNTNAKTKAPFRFPSWQRAQRSGFSHAADAHPYFSGCHASIRTNLPKRRQ